MEDSIETIKRQLEQLKELNASGVLSQQQYDEGRATLERRLLDLVLSGPATPALHSNESKKLDTPATGVSTRPSWRFIVILATSVLAVAAAGYWWKGAPDLASGSAAQVSKDAVADSAGAAPHATNFDQIAAMTEKLAARLKDQPNDAEGWAMLARSYSVLGKHPDALKAYEKAVALRKDDATLLADYADSLAVRNDRSLSGEPMKLVERALKLDPKNLKALSLAGTYAFDKKDYAGAVKNWEQVVQFGANDNALVQQVQSGLAEARQLAGLPAGLQVADATPAGKPLAVNGVVSGTVSLTAELRKQAQPEDTVFIFARAADGARMPLAILRKQVKDLPVQFTLDDSMAMSPATVLSGASKVIVGARISKSGNAVPQPGDLSGQSPVVSVGASGVKIEIKEMVKP